MAYDPEQRRTALQSFIDTNKIASKAWCRLAGLSESALWPFLRGKTTNALGDDTYELLADAATELLNKSVTAAMLRGEKPWAPDVVIESYVGAGDEVQRVAVDGGLGRVPAPTGYEDGGAAIVRGDSMRPVFDDGDLLFFRPPTPPPRSRPPTRPVIVQVRDGQLYVKKILIGSQRGLYHLVSINPIAEIMQDRPVESIARIGWIKPAH